MPFEINKLTYYGPANLIGTVFLVVFLIIGFKKYAKSDDYYTKIKPIKFVFWFLLILEIAKIIAHIAKNGTWNPKAFPIIYCSIAMYVYAIISYGKKDSLPVRMAFFNSVIPFVVIGALYWVSFPTIDWSLVTRYGYIMNLHSRLYHFCNLAVAFYIIGTKLYTFEFKDWLPAAIVNASYFVMATILSLFIGGEISNFGPESAELKNIFYAHTGYATGNLILALLCFALSFLLFLTINGIRNSSRKKKQFKKLSNNS